MNLKQLKYAAHVAETRSFSQAAKLSFSTQPTLSNAISQLEQTLGDKIFTRTTRKVELTAFGEYILPRILEVLHSKDELLKAADTYHNPEHQLLRIGFSPLVDMQRLNQILQPFKKANPEVSLFFKECFVDDLSSRLKKEQIDIKIIPTATTEDGEAAFPFYQDNLFYIPTSDTAPISSRLAFNIADLPDAPIILTGGGCGLNAALEDLLNADGVKLNAYPGQAMTYKVIEDWASLGIGAGILPQAKISPENSTTYPLFVNKGTAASFDYHWVWRSERVQPEMMDNFLNYIQTKVPALIDGQVNQAATAQAQ